MTRWTETYSTDFWHEKSQIWQAEHDPLVPQLQTYRIMNRTGEPEDFWKLIELASHGYAPNVKHLPEGKK